MSTHNICFREEIRKICGYPLLSVVMGMSVLLYRVNMAMYDSR